MARRQLLGLGFNARAIEHRVARGRLHLVMRGVYAVGWPQLTGKRRWMAAVLACGESAALSHRSAAALWGIGRELRGRIDVSVRRRCELQRPGLKVRGRPTLAADEVVLREDIPVSAPARAPLLRKLLDKLTFRLSDSDLEIFFRPIAAEAALPFPLSKQA